MKRRKGIEEAAHMPFFFFFFIQWPHTSAPALPLIAESSSKHLPKFSLLSIPSKVCDPLLSFSSLPSRFSSVSVCMQLLLRPPPFLRHRSFGPAPPAPPPIVSNPCSCSSFSTWGTPGSRRRWSISILP